MLHFMIMAPIKNKITACAFLLQRVCVLFTDNVFYMFSCSLSVGHFVGQLLSKENYKFFVSSFNQRF